MVKSLHRDDFAILDKDGTPFLYLPTPTLADGRYVLTRPDGCPVDDRTQGGLTQATSIADPERTPTAPIAIPCIDGGGYGVVVRAREVLQDIGATGQPLAYLPRAVKFLKFHESPRDNPDAERPIHREVAAAGEATFKHIIPVLNFSRSPKTAVGVGNAGTAFAGEV